MVVSDVRIGGRGGALHPQYFQMRKKVVQKLAILPES